MIGLITSFQGVSREDAETLLEVQRRFSSYHNGKRDIANFDEDARPMLKIVAREVANQQRRLGGDFAVAWAVVTRDAIGLR